MALEQTKKLKFVLLPQRQPLLVLMDFSPCLLLSAIGTTLIQIALERQQHNFYSFNNFFLYDDDDDKEAKCRVGFSRIWYGGCSVRVAVTWHKINKTQRNI